MTRMGNVQQYLIFASAAQLRGFAQAARAHGVTPSTVAKSVRRLEREFGVRPFHRTTRQVSLTPEGEAGFANCRRLLAEFERRQDTAADILVIYPSARQLAPRVRALVDTLVAAQLDHGKARGEPSGR